MELSVNVDHVATLREARNELYPDPVYAAVEADLGGADGITVHVRGDQRHIKMCDLESIRAVIQREITLEMSVTEEMMRLATRVRPHCVTLVPESPGEVTSQGGLDVAGARGDLKEHIFQLKKQGISVGIFIDPDINQVKAAQRVGAGYIEINTDEYSKIKRKGLRDEIIRIARVAKAAKREGLAVHAGHGLRYDNIRPLLTINEITGYSIGFAIVARAVFVGMRQATWEMVQLIKGAR
ncbi:MAG: pyridoxine 5'-phosphate synthase [candidate division WOR-3 bacterium]|nr:MAG: pyridoxine 5'-phosphate synthase [candidate division WOR-3 bacterium]